MNDIQLDKIIQIENAVDNAFRELKTNFANRQSENDYHLIFRSFVPSLRIGVTKTPKNILDFSVYEDFFPKSPEETLMELYKKHQYVDYNIELKILKELDKIQFIENVEKELLGRLKIKNNVHKKNFFETTQSKYKALGEEFIDWISSKDDFNLKKYVNDHDEYKHIISSFSYDNSIDILKNCLLYAFERKVKNTNIRIYVKKNKNKFKSLFNGHNTNIKSKLYAISLWNDINQNHNFENTLPNTFSEYKKHRTVLRQLEGNERIIVTEIVPNGLSNYHGNIGGKTIKIADYNSLNRAFNIAQSEFLNSHLHCKNGNLDKMLKYLRKSFHYTLASRRYVVNGLLDKMSYNDEHISKPQYEHNRINTTKKQELYENVYKYAKKFHKQKFNLELVNTQ